jgi:hypothetical protein
MYRMGGTLKSPVRTTCTAEVGPSGTHGGPGSCHGGSRCQPSRKSKIPVFLLMSWSKAGLLYKLRPLIENHMVSKR